MKLHLKVVRFMNFMSFGNEWTEIVLDQHPTTLVNGKNGSGKSSAILDSISFALFNKPFRNINKPQLANSINNKECIVELEFTVNGHEMVVRRGVKPTLFEIYKNDELITEDSDRRDYQDAFEKYILKVNHKTFCQIVMLGSAVFTPFMALKAGERRSVIEDLLDLRIFTRMNTLLKERIDVLETNILEQNKDKQILQDRIDLTQQHIEEMQKNNDELILQKRTQVFETHRSINGLNAAMDDAHDQITKLSQQTGRSKELASKFAKLTKLHHQLQHKSKLLDRDVEFLNENTVCPTCSQNIEEEFKTKALTIKSSDIADIQQAIAKLDTHFKKTKKDIEAIEDIQRKINDQSNRIASAQNSILFHERDIARIEKEIEVLQQKKEDIDTSKLTEWQTDITNIEGSLAEHNDDRVVMSFAASMLKDTGIKAKIIKTYIPVINQLIQKYLAILDFFVEFQIDETFQEKILSRFRDEFSYESFSEGEKARLNLAILFAWRALAKLRGSIDCNLVVFDEILDSSLDIEGAENFTKLITSLTQNCNAIIISHKEGLYEDKFDRVLKFEKVRNFSKLVM